MPFMKPVTTGWKAVNPTDDNLIFLLDSTSGAITVCGEDEYESAAPTSTT